MIPFGIFRIHVMILNSIKQYWTNKLSFFYLPTYFSATLNNSDVLLATQRAHQCT
jgi:hypothetical protein